MAFPFFTSTEAVPISIRRTFTAAADVATYQFFFDARLTLNTESLPTGKYIYVGNFGFYGSGGIDSGGNVIVLGLGAQGSGTNSGSLSMLRMAIDSGTLKASRYIDMSSASPGVTHFLRFAHLYAPCSTATGQSPGGNQVKIAIDVAGTTYYLIASATPA